MKANRTLQSFSSCILSERDWDLLRCSETLIPVKTWTEIRPPESDVATRSAGLSVCLVGSGFSSASASASLFSSPPTLARSVCVVGLENGLFNCD